MEEGEIVSDSAPKKLARQLDFTVMCRAPVQLHLPPHQSSVQPHSHLQLESKSSPPEPQQQVQSRGQCQTQLTSQSNRQPAAKPLSESALQPQTAQSPSKLPPRSHLQGMRQLAARHHQASVSNRTPHPVQKLPPPTLQLGKQGSPRSRLYSGIDAKDSTPKKQKQCNCKNSRCLKLYCECFAAGIHCDGCNCINCHNNSEKEEYRQEAINLTLDRNPNAFRPKIGSSPNGPKDAKDKARELQMVGKHNKGCHCKKSGCLKKYCECFQAEIFCSENCKCMDCKNVEGSEERRASSQGYHNSLVYMQQAANAAINGAIGLSGFGTLSASKKRKGDGILFGQAVKDQSVTKMAQAPDQQENPPGNPPPNSSFLLGPVSRTPNAAAVLGTLKPTLRSPLANVLKPQDVKEICSVLVVLSSEGAKKLPGKSSETDMQRESSNVKTAGSCVQASERGEKRSDLIAVDNHLCQKQADVDSNGKTGSNEGNMQRESYNVEVSASCVQASEKGSDLTAAGNHLCRNQSHIDSNDNSGSNEGSVQNGRPLSPGTRSLMCEEEDAMFLAAPSALPGHCQNRSKKCSNEHECTEVYAEQERLVLTSLRDFLNRLITCGIIKQTMSSSPYKRSQQTPVENPSIQSVNQTGCRKEPCSNSVVRSLNPATTAMSQTAVSSAPVNNIALKIGLTTGNLKINAETKNSNTQ